jgi:hypothetical protein
MRERCARPAFGSSMISWRRAGVLDRPYSSERSGMATASPWDDGHALPHWLSLGHLLLQAVLNAGGGRSRAAFLGGFHQSHAAIRLSSLKASAMARVRTPSRPISPWHRSRCWAGCPWRATAMQTRPTGLLSSSGSGPATPVIATASCAGKKYDYETSLCSGDSGDLLS